MTDRPAITDPAVAMALDDIRRTLSEMGARLTGLEKSCGWPIPPVEIIAGKSIGRREPPQHIAGTASAATAADNWGGLPPAKKPMLVIESCFMPQCGGEPSLRETFAPDGVRKFFVTCLVCQAGGLSCPDRATAIKAWNLIPRAGGYKIRTGPIVADPRGSGDDLPNDTEPDGAAADRRPGGKTTP